MEPYAFAQGPIVVLVGGGFIMSEVPLNSTRSENEASVHQDLFTAKTTTPASDCKQLGTPKLFHASA